MPARRSVLVAPASDPRKVDKALASAADAVVLDLEDAVEPGSKDRARASLVAVLSGVDPATATRVAVRVNAPRTPWCALDVLALAGLSALPGSIVLPKVDGPGDLALVDRLLDGAEAASGRPRLGVQALVETAAGLAAVQRSAAAGERLEALVLGYADLAASLGAVQDLALWLPAQSAVLVAARACGLQALDGPHLGLEVDEAFLAAARRARDLGFDGKWAVHPRQLEPLTEVFTPSEAEVRRARAVLEALEAAAAAGAGAVALDGQMLDEAVAAAARRVLTRAG